MLYRENFLIKYLVFPKISISSSYGVCIKKSPRFLGLPSLKTILIADLINAVSIGLIINPYFSTFTVATFPWILIPAVALPIALVLHGITLYRLRNWYQNEHAGNFQRLDASM
jgi:hypothetical protein